MHFVNKILSPQVSIGFILLEKAVWKGSLTFSESSV